MIVLKKIKHIVVLLVFSCSFSLTIVNADDKKNNKPIVSEDREQTTETNNNEEEKSEQQPEDSENNLDLEGVVDLQEIAKRFDLKFGGQDPVQTLLAIFEQIQMEAAKKEYEKKLAMFEMLPKNIQDEITANQQIYDELLEKLDLSTCLSLACVKIKQGLSKSDRDIVRAVILDKFHTALVNKSFVALLMGQEQPFPEMNSEEQSKPVEKYGKKDLEEVIGVLDSLKKDDSLSQEMQKNVVLLLDVLTALTAGDDDLFMQLIVDYIRPELDIVQQKLQKSVHNLIVERDKALADTMYEKADEDVKKDRSAIVDEKNNNEDEPKAITYEDAVREWYKDVKAKLTTLNVFESIIKRADLGVKHQSNGPLFRFIAHSYRFANKFFTIYKKDNSAVSFLTPGTWDVSNDWTQKFFKQYLFDYSIRLAMSASYYADEYATLHKSSLLGILLGQEQKLQNLSASDLWFNKLWIGGFAAKLLYSGPASLYNKKHYILEGLEDLFVSWSYYHAFHCHLFKDEVNPEFWPAKYEHLRQSVYSCVLDINKFFSGIVHKQIRNIVDAQTLENIEDKTMGVIQPELFGFFMKTLVPVVFARKTFDIDKIADFDRGVLYGKWFQKVQTKYAGTLTDEQLEKIQKDFEGSQEIKDLERLRYKAQGVNIDGYFIEYRIMDYVFSKVGFHWGRALGNKFRKPIMNLFLGVTHFVLDVLAVFGVISDETSETLQELQDEFTSEFDECIELIKKELLTKLFVPGSPIRMQILPLLIEHNYVNEKDIENDLAVMRGALSFVINELVSNNMIRHRQAITCMQYFDEKPNDIDGLIDKIVEAFKENIVGHLCGTVSEKAMSKVAEWLSTSYGPFYPKLTTRLSS